MIHQKLKTYESFNEGKIRRILHSRSKDIRYHKILSNLLSNNSGERTILFKSGKLKDSTEFSSIEEEELLDLKDLTFDLSDNGYEVGVYLTGLCRTHIDANESGYPLTIVMSIRRNFKSNEIFRESDYDIISDFLQRLSKWSEIYNYYLEIISKEILKNFFNDNRLLNRTNISISLIKRK